MSEKDNNIMIPFDAINEFYKMKDRYESGYYEKYVKPIVMKKSSKASKRQEYAKLPKHECINCKRNVGTVFTIKVDKSNYLRNFMAKCGDHVDPCPLDINIRTTERVSYDEEIAKGTKEMNNIKVKIIVEKNNAMFFPSEGVAAKFDELTTLLKDVTEDLGLYVETDILVNDNPVKAELLKKEQDEFGKGMILPFKQMIADFNSGNDLIIPEAVQFYVNEMVPKINSIRNTKYEINYVDYDGLTGQYHLYQRKNSLENRESALYQQDKVISFVKGTKTKETRAKTIKARDELKGQTKTRKIRRMIELVEEPEQEQEQQEQEQQEPQKQQEQEQQEQQEPQKRETPVVIDLKKNAIPTEIYQVQLVKGGEAKISTINPGQIRPSGYHVSWEKEKELLNFIRTKYSYSAIACIWYGVDTQFGITESPKKGIDRGKPVETAARGIAEETSLFIPTYYFKRFGDIFVSDKIRGVKNIAMFTVDIDRIDDIEYDYNDYDEYEDDRSETAVKAFVILLGDQQRLVELLTKSRPSEKMEGYHIIPVMSPVLDTLVSRS